jgi:hypothetical protein
LTSKLSQHQAHATLAKFNNKGQFKSLRIPPKGTPQKKSKKNTNLKNPKGLFKHFEISKIPLRELRSKHLACPPISSLFLNWIKKLVFYKYALNPPMKRLQEKT